MLYCYIFFIGENEFNLWIFWSNLWTMSIYWIIGTIYTVMYITGKPSYLMKYKVQQTGDEDITRERVIKVND